VVFRDISDDEIDLYIRSNEHLDKAGSYGIQGKAAKFVKEIHWPEAS
jgi:septum formation protein